MQTTVTAQPPGNVDPMLGLCWSAVCDTGPPLTQHWVTIAFLLGGIRVISGSQGAPKKQEACNLNFGLMLGERCKQH